MVGPRRSLAVVVLALSIVTAAACSGGDSPDTDQDRPSQSQPTIGESAAPTLDEVARHVGRALKAYDGVATGAVVLVRVGEQTRVLASGRADVKQQRPMRPSDRFPIQSITTTMVATAVLQLVAAGKLGLDDHVEDDLPGLLPQGRRITIRNLLIHRSGLNDPPRPTCHPWRA